MRMTGIQIHCESRSNEASMGYVLRWLPDDEQHDRRPVDRRHRWRGNGRPVEFSRVKRLVRPPSVRGLLSYPAYFTSIPRVSSPAMENAAILSVWRDGARFAMEFESRAEAWQFTSGLRPWIQTSE